MDENIQLDPINAGLDDHAAEDKIEEDADEALAMVDSEEASMVVCFNVV